MSAQAPGTFAAEDEEAIDAEIAALHKQLAERTAEHQHLRQQLAEEEQQGCAARRCLAGGLPDRQLLLRRARCAEKLPQLQSAVGAAAPAVSGRVHRELFRWTVTGLCLPGQPTPNLWRQPGPGPLALRTYTMSVMQRM